MFHPLQGSAPAAPAPASPALAFPPPFSLAASAPGRRPARVLAPGSREANERLLAWLDARFEEYGDHEILVRNHSAQSVRWHRHGYQNFRHYLREHLHLPEEEFKATIFGIEAWVRWNRENGRGPVTTNTYWRGLKGFFNDLEKRDDVQNPFHGLKAPPLPARLPKALSPDECRRLLRAAENYPWESRFERSRALALLAVMIYAGLRRGEVLKLEMQDVKLEDGTINIRRGKGRYGGKDRTAYIPAELRLYLRDYLAERARYHLVVPEFFTTNLRKRGLSLDVLKRLVTRIRAASGVTFTLHSLRHSYVTWLLRSGVPIHIAQELAGHADITTTAGYLRVFDEDKQAAVRKLHLG